MAKADNIFRRILWPTDTAEAEWAARFATWLAAFCGFLIALSATLDSEGVSNHLLNLTPQGYLPKDVGAYLDAGAFVLLSFFVIRMSRVASVLALSLFLFGWLIGFYGDSPTTLSLIVRIVFTLIFVNGVRGTFAWHRLAKEVTEESTQLTHTPTPT